MSVTNNLLLESISGLCSIIDEIKDTNARVAAINQIRAAIHQLSPQKDHPIDLVLWVPISDVQKNDYNPNAVAPTEMKLLETSILEDGYTQPVVTWLNDDQREIVDGFHRTRTAKESERVAASLNGFIPVTTVRNRQTDKSNRMASTIRHNRARGTHSVDAMSDIVLELKARNWKTERICKELGMEEDEVLRLCQINGLTTLFSDVEFTKAWESDSCADNALDFEADFSVITQNTSDPHRVFHTFDKWEAVPAGFFSPGIKGRKPDECEAEYAAFLSNLIEFESAALAVFEHWPNSSEHNLTNSSMNRIAWIGQAAACFKRGLPATYRGGFSLLSPEQQKAADLIALKCLNVWLSRRGQKEISLDDAYGHRDSDLF